jgi:ATP-dependent DNA helicase RecQ
MNLPVNATFPAAPSPILEVLTQRFGFSVLREGQAPVMERLLAGSSVLAIFPTGAGKSLCYQLPALLLDGLTLVISPLIALMKDQIEFLESRGIAAARLDSSLERGEALAIYEKMRNHELKILYTSPERFGSERFRQTLRGQTISLLAVDEAHCISEWGHNFRPDYLKIAALSREVGAERVLALTATATPSVARDIAAGFGIVEGDIVHTGFYRPNLHLRVTPSSDGERLKKLAQRLRERPAGPTIVYVTLQRTAEQVASYLRKAGFDAAAYHAGMETPERTLVQDAFMASDHKIVVATIAFGMGIDKSNIRTVYHYNLPKCLESYAQEIGRAGRDGEPAVCELLACADDATVLENFTYGDTPTPEAVAAVVTEILSQGAAFDVSEYDLSSRHDVRPLVVKTLLAYLELEGAIRATGSFFTEYKFKPQRSSKEILARFDPARADFLHRVLRFARKGVTWFKIDTEEAARALGEPRERILAALSFLDESGDIVLEASGSRQGYRLLEGAPPVAALCESLAQRFMRREEQDIARMRDVLAYAGHPGCLTRQLLAYFGEERGDCGHCGHCAGEPAQTLAPARTIHPGASEASRLDALRAEGHAALASPRQVARFLCGIASPATSRAKLRSHALFGSLESTPFHEVLAFAEKRWQSASA